MMNRRRPGSLPGVLLGAGFLAAAGCDPMGPRLPDASPNSPHLAGAPTSHIQRTDLFANQNSNPSCTLLEPVTVRPREFQAIDHCGRMYEFDFSLQADTSGSSLLDLFRDYPITRWNVRQTGATVRHDVSVLWDPFNPYVARHSSFRGVPPLIAQICPGAAVPQVVGCSETGCETYTDEDDVPTVFPPSTTVVFESPWGYSTLREIREGDVLRVPVAYRVLAPREGRAIVTLERDSPASSREFEVTPEERTVSLQRRRSGNIVFEIRAKRDRFRQTPSEEVFRLSVSHRPEVCSVRPNWLRVFVRN